MGFDRDYSALIALATELGHDGGFQGVEAQKEINAANARYAAERDRAAYAILSEKPDLELVYLRIREDLEVYAEDNPGWADIASFVAEDLIGRLQELSAMKPAMRMAKRYGGLAVLAVLGLIYVGLFLYNDLAVDKPLETKAGILQRAAAYDKARNHDSLMGGRGGLIKTVVLMPWEPDEAELNAASEFAGLTFEGLQALTDEGIACNTQSLLVEGEYLAENQLEFVDQISEYVQAAGTKWEEPPVMTLLPAMVQGFACPAGAAPPSSGQ